MEHQTDQETQRAEPESRIQPQMPLFGARHDGIPFGCRWGQSMAHDWCTNNNILVVIMKFAIARNGNIVQTFRTLRRGYSLHGREWENCKESGSARPGSRTRQTTSTACRALRHAYCCRGMGSKAVNLFCANNIKVFLGISGDADSVIRDFIGGSITPGQSSCTHGSDHESCGY